MSQRTPPGPDGLPLLGNTHQRGRIQPAFYREKIRRYADRMVAEAERTREEWTDGDVRDVETEMKSLTLRILVSSMFGADLDYEGLDIRETVAASQWITHRDGRFWSHPDRFDPGRWLDDDLDLSVSITTRAVSDTSVRVERR